MDQVRKELGDLLGREERLKTIKGNIDKAIEQYSLVCTQLSSKRIQTGRDLAKQVEKGLKELGLTHAQLSVVVSPLQDATSPVIEKGLNLHLSPNGWDKVEFHFSANPGEPLRPLAKVASGGEASRVMLALKTVLVESDEVPTLIFDEIDTGVGARTAPAVAQLLQKLSQKKQVLCISHLAPIAGLGDNHMRISKTLFNKKTSVHVELLRENDRIDELAKMMAGEPVSETSRAHAKELYAKMHGK